MTSDPLFRALSVLALAAVSLTGTSAVALVLIFATASPGNSSPASAPELAASEPADRAALATAPEAVKLVFSAPAAVEDSHIAVLAEGGASVGAGELASPAPDTLRQPVAATGPGTFTVAYHVTFDDGAEATGVIRFSVGTGEPPPPLGAAEADAATDAAAVEHPHMIDPLSAVLLVLDGLAVAIVAALLMRRRPVP
jgi:methionine-rich copper-binding protein CopC